MLIINDSKFSIKSTRYILMSKSNLSSIQDSMQKMAQSQMQSVGSGLLDKMEKMALNPEQKKAVGDAFDKSLKDMQGKATGKVGDLSESLQEALEEQLKKINILPEDMRKKIAAAGKDGIEKISKLATEAIGHAGDAAMEVAGAVMEQFVEAVKTTFSNVRDVLKGDKTKEQAMEGIKNAWKDAGQKVMESAKTAKKSFVEKMGGSKGADKKSHVEKVAAQKSNPAQSQGRG